MFKHYIWDFDGTLYDTYPVILDGFVAALKELHQVADRKEVYRTLKAHSSKELAHVFQLPFDQLTAVYKDIESKDPRVPVPFQGAKEILEWVVASGHTNYILTHRDTPGTKELLEKDELLDNFKEIIGSESPFPGKPAPDAIQYLMEKYQMNPNETVMIGDRNMDILAGNAAGVKTIFFDEDQLLIDVPATYEVNELLAIRAINS